VKVSARPRPLPIVAAGWLAVMIYGYPGQLTERSLAILHGARSHDLDERVAPAMAWLWRGLELVVAGPGSVLYAQVTLFAAGAYALLRIALQPTRAAVATALVMVFPPVCVGITAISAHAMTACLLVACVGAMLGPTRRPLWGIAALIAAAAIDPFATVATPLVVLIGLHDGTRPGARRRSVAVAAWLVACLIGCGIGAALANVGRPVGAAPPADDRGLVARAADAFGPGDGRAPAVLARTLPESALAVGVPIHASALQELASTVLGAIDHATPVFWPGVYLVVAIAALGFGRRRPEVVATLTGAIGFEFAHAARGEIEYTASLYATAMAVFMTTVLSARRGTA
jgi:hypothetical protein